MVDPGHQHDTSRLVQAWFRALDHARLLGVKPFWRVGDYYTVDSPSSGRRHIVRPIYANGKWSYTCTCEAAVGGKVCWHRALVAALPHEHDRRKQAPIATQTPPRGDEEELCRF